MSPPYGFFFDRDGTLIKKIPYLHEVDKVKLLPGTIEAFHIFSKRSCRLFLFTNQSGVGRGWFSMEEVHQCNQALIQQLPQKFDDICVAHEAPDAPPIYRKPSPKFVFEMQKKYTLDPKNCWMIGDADCDEQLAQNADIHFVKIQAQTAFQVFNGKTISILSPSLLDFAHYLDRQCSHKD